MSSSAATSAAKTPLDLLAALLSRRALPIYAATIFLSAFLLFSVQPMFTKMVTPVLGGTPAVWSVAMVFFQAVLLAGYAYAHGLLRTFDTRTAALVHVALIGIVTLVALPIAFNPSWGRPPGDGAALWLIAVFAASVGLPFFAVSANGPLLQAWFSQSGHADAKDPYFLYGASNLGSFVALIAYPLLIEPNLTLKGQSSSWSAGFMALGLAIGVCALALAACRLLRPAATAQTTDVSAPAASMPITTARRLSWIGLSSVPSALLIAFTAHMSTDIAAVPLLWVIPLALFLLTFVIAFSARGSRWHGRFVSAQPALIALFLGVHFFPGLTTIAVSLAAQFALFFVAVMVCHGQLYQDRPAAGQLTEFYFFLSLGGVLGGVFASLIAPAIFNDVFEYFLLVFAATLCRPGFAAAVALFGVRRTIAVAAAAIALFAALSAANAIAITPPLITIVVIPIMGLLILWRSAPLRIAALTALALAFHELPAGEHGVVAKARSFFAVHSIHEFADGSARFLMHGGTVHGGEWVRDKSGAPITARPDPVSYFYPGGPYAEAIDAARAAQGGQFRNVAVIGLGMGALACHTRPGEAWDFHEIDPVVARIARDGRWFRSMSLCAPDARVILGDGRLTIADATRQYDLIVIDAFSSDAIPVHLLTAEALALYASKLTEHGAIVFNITNRYMELDSVVARSAAAAGLLTYHRYDGGPIAPFEKSLHARAKVAVAARRPQDLGSIPTSGTWTFEPPRASERLWTDDYSNIIAPIAKKFGW